MPLSDAILQLSGTPGWFEAKQRYAARATEKVVRHLLDAALAAIGHHEAGETNMPFKSQAQRAFMYAKHPTIAKRFQAETPKGTKLPKHVKKQKR